MSARTPAANTMSKKRNDPLLDALREGRSYTWTVPEGGDLASMRQAIRHGQTLTMAPVTDPGEIRAGDLVLVKWHGSDIFHVVGEVRDDRFLIVNSVGGVNGWVGVGEILGRITKIVEPEPRPAVPAMIDELGSLFGELARRDPAAPAAAVAGDLRWYAGRIGEERWDVMPRSNKWSFAQNLWRLLRRARDARSAAPVPVGRSVDAGKQCVGLAAEICGVLEGSRRLV